jgi:hypothetical protein
MLRTIFTIGLFAVLGVVALNLLFGIFSVVVGLALWLFWIALKIALVGLIIYFVIRVVSPDTARRMRERWSGSSL